MLKTLNQFFTRLTDHQDGGKLLLRVSFSILILFHGVAKVQHGVGWIGDLLVSKGLPYFIAYGAYIGEIAAPILIILGIFTRPAALVVAINLLVATLLVGMGKFFTLTNVGAWGLESEAFFFLGAVITMMLGSGRYSMVGPDYR
ncbi:DoxX family protein [Pragia fontium]|uniref:Oxidoreductase n=1 Tax=Pragia fontium DSM 5563 = ATCC 49100 TaxID=1122977 RepID=A0AAJ4W9X4_9GAMM|nr:DoxX family protein [Pragia fontium]SFC65251.1 putative oxidoreductase [Pragia fontium DSM 5563 = ATCC 49100]VEJ56496.1 DoxX [Pragia fontium]